ncbi:MAG: hypothetical protein WC812_02350 [Candidatus Pacearchaeota archaeon]|jgi:hypothetical protein
MRFIEEPIKNEDSKKLLILNSLNEEVLIKDSSIRWVYGKIVSYDKEKGKYSIKELHHDETPAYNLEIKNLEQFLLVR